MHCRADIMQVFLQVTTPSTSFSKYTITLAAFGGAGGGSGKRFFKGCFV